MKSSRYYKVLLFFFLIFLGNLFWTYWQYCHFDQRTFRQGKFLVLNEYKKLSAQGREYQVLKLGNNKEILYLTWFRRAFLKKGDLLSLTYKPIKVTFKAFILKRFLIQGKNIQRLEKDKEKNLRTKIKEKIHEQHDNKLMKELYAALYLAEDFDLSLRNALNQWGSSHLIVISGYHMLLLFSTLYFPLHFFYKFFQNRYFPYRNAKFDLSLIIFSLLFFYLYLVNFPPSFLRSFAMSLLAFALLARNVKITSFKFLFLIYLALISTNLHLLFSVGFYFSCAGVFYIYLYIHHFKDSVKNIFLNFLLFNIFVFYAMNIPVFYFFPMMTFYQPSVVLISLIFNIFYPLSIILHFFGKGGFFDKELLAFLTYELPSKDILLSWKVFLSYNLLSFSAIFSKKLALSLMFFSFYVTYIF